MGGSSLRIISMHHGIIKLNIWAIGDMFAKCHNWKIICKFDNKLLTLLVISVTLTGINNTSWGTKQQFTYMNI